MGSTSTTPAASLTIGSLDIRGFVSSHGVSNFLGIPYAEIPARFRQAKPLNPETLKGVHDGTKYGPRCPQPVDHPKVLRSHLYEGVEPSESVPCSEYRCLNLNIFAPPEAVHSQQKLPVYVWIHGGAWTTGDGGLEYDGNYLVQHAIKLGKPIVYVGINYRLGYYGWLTSQELRDEAVGAGEIPFRSMGLLDQRLALQWIQQNISHFGGDPDNVTISGESAGGWSVLAHLQSNVPVCRRGIAMSSPSWRFMSPEANQASFNRLVNRAGIKADAPATEKLAALRDLTFEQLNASNNNARLLPAWDPEWFVDLDPTYPQHMEDVEEFPQWVEAVVVGHTRDEYALFAIARNQHKWTKEEIQANISQNIVDSNFTKEVFELYGIDNGTLEEAREGMFTFGSDSVFGIAPIKIGQCTKTPVSVYRFDQVDRGEQSPFKGYAFHGLDNVFSPRFPAVVGTSAPEDYKATAEHHSRMLIDFCHGQQPWEPYTTRNKIMCFNGEETGLTECPELVSRLDKMMATRDKESLFRLAGWGLMQRRGQVPTA